jgi:tetratricopeptide (TPR) repeat protein
VQVLELEPGHRSAYVMRGEAHRQLGNEQQAIEDYTRALFIDPTDVDAYLVRGEANLADHNHLDALHDFQRALDLQVGNPVLFDAPPSHVGVSSLRRHLLQARQGQWRFVGISPS